MRKKIFTVIIPAYNASKVILGALQSVGKQSYTSFETIVIDDGSTDETPNIVSRYFEEHPQMKGYLIRQENKKVAAARNQGLNAASGEWLAFLDADDIWIEKKLEQVVKIIQDNPNVDLVCHDQISILQGKKGKKIYCGPYDSYLDILLKSCCLSPSAVCVRKEKIIEIGGFNESAEYFGTEDFDLWMRLAKNGCRFFYLHEFLGIRRETLGSISDNVASHTDNYLQAVRDHFYSLSSNLQKRHNIKYRQRCSAIVCGGGRRFLSKGDFINAKKCYKKGIRLFPFNLKGYLGYVLGLIKLKI